MTGADRLERRKSTAIFDLRIAEKQLELADNGDAFIHAHMKAKIKLLQSEINAINDLIRDAIIGDSNY